MGFGDLVRRILGIERTYTLNQLRKMKCVKRSPSFSVEDIWHNPDNGTYYRQVGMKDEYKETKVTKAYPIL